MSIVAYTDFTAERIIPNASKSGVKENIQAFIDKYELKYLTSLLGESLYNSFVTGLAAAEIDPKWTALKDKIQPAIVDYVYWFYMRNNATQTTDTGEAIAASANAGIVSPGNKMVDAWNEMVAISYQAVLMINTDTDFYGNWYLNNLVTGTLVLNPALYRGEDNFYRDRVPDIFVKQNTSNI